MRKIDYFQMRAYFYSKEENLSVNFKLNELEQLWFCTQKSVKRKLKQYIDGGWIHYHPGIGRGNPSIIVFTLSLQEEIEKEVDQLIELDFLEDIIQLLQLPLPHHVTSNVLKKVQALFGLQLSNEAKDTLRTIMSSKITTLDPLYTSMNFETFLLHQLGDTLVTYDKQADAIRPQLAYDWESDSEHTIWTFYLRKSVRFHNHQLLTSEDVRHTFDRFKTQISPHQWLVDEIKQIECPSAYVVRFELQKSNPFFLRYVSSHNLVIQPKNVPFDENQWIGSGPFQLKKRTETLLELEAFDEYFLARPFIDVIQTYIVESESSKLINYDIDRNGDLMKPHEMLATEVGFRYLAFNFKNNSIVHNRLFREALYHLFDIKEMWKELKRSDLRVSSSYFHWKSKPKKLDKSRIADLIHKSGYSGETLTIFTIGSPYYLSEANWLKKESEKYGIQFTIKTCSVSQLYTPQIEDADLLLMDEVASKDYHLSFIGAFLNKTYIFNRFFTSEHMKELVYFLEKIKQETNPEKREDILDLVEEYIRNDNLLLYLYHPVKKRIFNPMINNIEFDSYGFVDCRKLWIRL